MQVLQLALDIARGLEFLHSERIVHGALRPSNVMLEASGAAKLADYGLNRVRRTCVALVVVSHAWRVLHGNIGHMYIGGTCGCWLAVQIREGQEGSVH